MTGLYAAQGENSAQRVPESSLLRFSRRVVAGANGAALVAIRELAFALQYHALLGAEPSMDARAAAVETAAATAKLMKITTRGVLAASSVLIS